MRDVLRGDASGEGDPRETSVVATVSDSAKCLIANRSNNVRAGTRLNSDW